MKKMLFVIIGILMLNTALSARIYEGKIQEIKVTASGISITLPGIRRSLSGDPEAIKQMYAMALTAKAANLTVQIDRDYATETWVAIILP